MDLEALLLEVEPGVLDEAYATLRHSHVTHYEAAGEALTRRRLADLFALLVAAIGTRDLAPMGDYARTVARERFNEGFDISEVQLAFNALEAATWRRLLSLDRADLAEAVGLLGTVVGFGKDALAREYVSLASRRHVPSLDLSALFAGANS